ncbi:MAG: NADPH-dependent F420 reductase [Dehalococcoidia bacterium]
MRIAILGGTGDEGLGLAMRFAAAKDTVIIGSRASARAEAAADHIREAIEGAAVSGADNAEAAGRAEVVFVTVPYSAQRATLEPLSEILHDKLVVTAVVPLAFGKGGPRAVEVPEGSAAQEAQAILTGSRVVGAFHNISAHELQQLDRPVECDVIVCGADRESRQVVIDLAGKIPGVRGIDGGPLAFSRYVEDMTALLLALNRRYKTETGIRITGIDARQSAVGSRQSD